MPTNVRYSITRVITPADSLALVSLDDAKVVLGIDAADTSKDAALTQQIDAVSAAVNNYCNRVFAVQSYQDQFRYVYNWLYSGEPLRTRQFPIVVDDAGVPLVAVFEDGAAVDVAAWDVYPEEGALYRLDGTTVAAWLGTTLLVDYTAGYDPIPADVQGAALEWLTARWFALGRDPALRSETVPDLISQVYAGDAGAGTSGGAIPPGARDLLAPYKIWSV
jgi:hypothetical protein